MSIPESIGRFGVRSCLGKGGMGAVYLGVDPRIDRLVALKVLHVHDDDVGERFLREARAAGRLQHPNIVTIFEVGDHEGQPFIAMEYVAGETIAEMVARHAELPITRKLELMEGLCAGLACAHQAGIIHRDIKPANLMVSKTGILKILDFGVARLSESGGTTAGMSLGTPAYMSPEQMEGEAVGIRSDVFSVGAVFYELLSYQQAFTGESYAQLRHQIVNRTLEPLARLAGVVDPSLIEILRHALARNPQDRYAGVDAMQREVARAAECLAAAPDPDPDMDEGELTLFAASPFVDVSGPSPTQRAGVDRTQLLERRANQLAAQMSRARKMLAKADFAEARAAAEAAAVLDPDNPGVLDLLERIHAKAKAHQIRRAVDTARDRLEVGDFAEAQRYADEALLLSPGNADAQQIRRDAEQAALERESVRERARDIAESTARAQKALAAGAFDLAIRAADEVLAFDPAQAEASAIRTQAVEAVEEARRQASLDSRAEQEIESARISCEAGHHESAIRRLEQFTPEHPLVRQTLAELRRQVEVAARRRQEEDQRHLEHASGLVGAGDMPGPLASAGGALAVDEHHEAGLALRAEIQHAAALTEANRRDAQDVDLARRRAALGGAAARLRRVVGEGVGALRARMTTRTGQLSALATVVVLLLGGLWWMVGSGPGPAPDTSAAQQEAESLLQRGALIEAAERIQQALAEAPGDEGLVTLAGSVLGEVRGLAREARQAAAGTSAERLVRAEASEAEAEQLTRTDDIAGATRAFMRTVTLYREAAMGDAALAQLLSQAEEQLGAGDVGRAAEFAQQALALAPAEPAVVALTSAIWEVVEEQNTQARRSAVGAGGSSLATFGEASGLRDEAVQMYEDADVSGAVRTLSRSGDRFGDARAEARGELAGRIETIVSSAQALLAGGQLIDAAAETARGLEISPRHERLRELATEIRSAAATRATDALATVPAAGRGVVGDAEALLVEADAAGDDFESAVRLYVDAAAGFLTGVDSFEGGVKLALEEGGELLEQGALERAASRLMPALEDGLASALAPQVRALVANVREAAEKKAAQARQRASENDEHPAFSIAKEQADGAYLRTGASQLHEAVTLFETAVTYFDEAAAAANVQPGFLTLRAAWETAWDANNLAELERLYPDSLASVSDWREGSPDSADWTLDDCEHLRRLPDGAWQTICRGTIADNPIEYQVTIRAEGDAWVFRDLRDSDPRR